MMDDSASAPAPSRRDFLITCVGGLAASALPLSAALLPGPVAPGPRCTPPLPAFLDIVGAPSGSTIHLFWRDIFWRGIADDRGVARVKPSGFSPGPNSLTVFALESDRTSSLRCMDGLGANHG